MRTVILCLVGCAAFPAMAQDPTALDCVIEPRSIVDLTPSEEGTIHSILVGRGDSVEAGAAVAQLDDQVERLQVELSAVRATSDADVRSQRARLALRQQELVRAKALKQRNVATGTQVDEAEIEVTLTELAIESAETEQKLAEIEHEQAKARLARRQLKSPVRGVVIGVDAAPGEFAHEQTTILRIAEIDPLHVEVFAPAELFGQIVIGQDWTVKPMQPIGGAYTATVSVVDPVFDAASGTFGVRLDLPNPDGAIPAGVRCTLEDQSG